MQTSRQLFRVPATLLAALLTLAGLAVTTSGVHAQTQTQTQTQTQERIYGNQLMTEQERNEYRNQMRNLRTEQERQAFREQHHQRMLARARERGVQIPDEPPRRAAPGAGMGPGGGMGGGGRGR